jgi:hypothetical protein
VKRQYIFLSCPFQAPFTTSFVGLKIVPIRGHLTNSIPYDESFQPVKGSYPALRPGRSGDKGLNGGERGSSDKWEVVGLFGRHKRLRIPQREDL